MAFRLSVAASILWAVPLAAEPVDPPVTGTITYAQPDVAEQNGNVVYYDRVGSEHPLTKGGQFIQPELSSDGTKAVFVKVEADGEPGTGTARTSIWMADVRTRKSWRLLASSPSPNGKANLAAMWHPRFSPDGKTVYVEADTALDFWAIHRIDVATTRHQFVTIGALLRIIAEGKNRGNLLVGRMQATPGANAGAEERLYVVRPGGKFVAIVSESRSSAARTPRDTK